MAKPAIVFRADGHARMGLGHLVRSAALAEMLAPSNSPRFALRCCPPELRRKLIAKFPHSIELHSDETIAEATELRDFALGLGPVTVVVLDGYHFHTEYQRVLVEAGLVVACIDDIHAYHFLAHLVINHAGGIEPAMYSAEPYTRFCLGPQFALLRPPFCNPQHTVAAADKPRIGFICLGGADPPNATLGVLQTCLRTYPGYTFDVVTGEAYSHQDSLEKFVQHANASVRLHTGLDAAAMAKLMAASVFGVTSPSTVSFEYLSVGGTLYLVPIADNQADIYAYFLTSGMAYSFAESFPLQDEDRLADGLQRRVALFDGRAAERYLSIFQSLIN